jgi:hypothetical protein
MFLFWQRKEWKNDKKLDLKLKFTKSEAREWERDRERETERDKETDIINNNPEKNKTVRFPQNQPPLTRIFSSENVDFIFQQFVESLFVVRISFVERQRDRETERQRGREAERQRDRYRDRDKEIETKIG